MSLEHVSEENLKERWDSLLEKYIKDIKTIKEILFVVDDTRKEMIVIREELLRRNIEVDASKNIK
jgi:GTP-binding protein EngB required for normal cell division